MKEKSESGILRWLIPIAALLLVVMGLFLSFSNRIKEESEQTVQKEMQDIVEKYAVKVDTELQYVRVAGETVAQVMKSLQVRSKGTISMHMQAVIEKTGAYEAIYYEKDQKCIDQKGNQVELTEKEYFSFIDQTTNETQYYFLEDDEITGQSAILITVPVPENKAVMLLFYPTQSVKELLKMDATYGQVSAVAIVNAEGEILEHNDAESNFLSADNLWSNIDKEYESLAKKARTNMQRTISGCSTLAANGEERTLVYMPLGINDWTFVAGVSQHYVEKSLERVWRSTSTMLYQLIGVILLFIIIFGIIYIISKKRNTEKSRELQEKADMDLLTGLNNKLTTERKIKEYMKEKPDTLAMMFVLDIDNFKKINDTMGHAFGDEVLSNLGRRISANFRVTDIIGRTGGDEFTIFLKALKDDENTLKEAQKLLNFFRDFQVGEYVKYSATASIGAAVFPKDGNDFETLYKAADQALYKAKKRGKNQLAFYDDRDQKE